MKALSFGNHFGRLAATRVLSILSARALTGPLAPIQMKRASKPELPGEDWVIIRTRVAGICGSDFKQVSLNGTIDNPMTAFISFPHVLGHEGVGVVEKIGPSVKSLRVGQRVAMNPWLSCGPRGLPLCEWCENGQFAQCLNFTEGRLSNGVHVGNCRSSPGCFAELFPAHESMAIPIPEGISDEQAVLADPFSVSFHAVTRNPPPSGGSALVYGCGTLGLMTIAILRHFFPDTRILAIARYEHQAKLARELGAGHVLCEKGRRRSLHQRQVIEWISQELGQGMHRPWRGPPVIGSGVDVVYDNVSSATTLEASVRVIRSRGKLVVVGVEPARRFEWTPLYFKEISIIGSNAFGDEELAGRKQHAFLWYFEWLLKGAPSLSGLITHRFSLDDYRSAFYAGKTKAKSGLVKALFVF